MLTRLHDSGQHKRTTLMGVMEAATIMGVTPQFLRIGLQLGKFPFGTAVRMPGGRWSYYINAARFERYMQGADMVAERRLAQ